MVRPSKKIIEQGLRPARSLISEQDKIWSKYSTDKVDIGETLGRVIRTLQHSLPLSQPLRALSLGSSNEPQFRILQSVFQGGLYLVDIDAEALGIVSERISRQNTQNVHPLRCDFDRIFLDLKETEYFFRHGLRRKRMELITLQHSLYYCERKKWGLFFRNLCRNILAPRGAVYAVLMSARSRNPDSTTWLYNHFAGKFCGHTNDQDLLGFKKELAADPCFRRSEILTRTHEVRFLAPDFEKFMAVVWMILLYPQVHRYSLDERREITEFCWRNFFLKQKPLLQEQDHLIIYRGLARR